MTLRAAQVPDASTELTELPWMQFTGTVVMLKLEVGEPNGKWIWQAFYITHSECWELDPPTGKGRPTK